MSLPEEPVEVNNEEKDFKLPPPSSNEEKPNTSKTSTESVVEVNNKEKDVKCSPPSSNEENQNTSTTSTESVVEVDNNNNNTGKDVKFPPPKNEEKPKASTSSTKNITSNSSDFENKSTPIVLNIHQLDSIKSMALSLTKSIGPNSGVCDVSASYMQNWCNWSISYIDPVFKLGLKNILYPETVHSKEPPPLPKWIMSIVDFCAASNLLIHKNRL